MSPFNYVSSFYTCTMCGAAYDYDYGYECQYLLFFSFFRFRCFNPFIEVFLKGGKYWIKVNPMRIIIIGFSIINPNITLIWTKLGVIKKKWRRKSFDFPLKNQSHLARANRKRLYVQYANSKWDYSHILPLMSFNEPWIIFFNVLADFKLRTQNISN